MGIIQRIRRSRERRRTDRELEELREHAPYTPALEGMPPAPRQNSRIAERVAVMAVASVFALSPFLAGASILSNALSERQHEAQAEVALEAARSTYSAALNADYQARGEEMPEISAIIRGEAKYQPTTEAAQEAHEDVVAAEARAEALEENDSSMFTGVVELIGG